MGKNFVTGRTFTNFNFKSKSVADSEIMEKNIFEIYFLLLISNKEVMVSSLPLRSNFLDLPRAQGRGLKLPILGFVKNSFAHKYPLGCLI
jgi:hypothetical protein